MDIAMVNPSLVDAHLDRIHRLVDGVNAFKERLDHMWAAYGPSDQSQPAYEPMQMQAGTIQSEPVFTQPVSDTKVTADDVDIDAILNDIDLSGDFSL